MSRRALAAFVVVFATAHSLSASVRREDDGYHATLTFWTLLATAALVACPRLPGACGSAVLAVNVLVVALYYSLVNRGAVTGESVLLHGGCALALLVLVATGYVAVRAPPLAAAALAGGALLLNAVVQLRYERRSGRLLYPGCALKHSGWRLAALPVAGALLAAYVAS